MSTTGEPARAAADAGGRPGPVAVDGLMDDLRARVRERLRQDLLRHGAPADYQDAALFAEVERILHTAVDRGESPALMLPELLGPPDGWRLETAMRFPSHRSAGPAAFIRFAKERVLMPLLRWLFEYSRDNFERQRRVNLVLFACVQELATETARLRHDLRDRR